jgi:hypothetical protein
MQCPAITGKFGHFNGGKAPRFEVAANRGGLNRSMQHWLEVYSQEFQSPRFFAGVD